MNPESLAILEKLARAKKPCGDCFGTKQALTYTAVTDLIADLKSATDTRGIPVACPTCGGTGEVLRFPKLSKECPEVFSPDVASRIATYKYRERDSRGRFLPGRLRHYTEGEPLPKAVTHADPEIAKRCKCQGTGRVPITENVLEALLEILLTEQAEYVVTFGPPVEGLYGCHIRPIDSPKHPDSWIGEGSSPEEAVLRALEKVAQGQEVKDDSHDR